MTQNSLKRLISYALLAGLTLLPLAHVRAEDSWIGLGVLKGGKGYAPSPMGQVHYRDLGPRDAKVPVLLLHMTPLSMNQFGLAQPELAKLGIRSIAVDTPGYGLSDPPDKEPTIADFADNLMAVLDYLKIQKVVLAGHHTGASIATSFAVRHPDRVAAVILHGVPIFNQEEIDVRLKRGGLGDRTPKPDGSHLSQFFRWKEGDGAPPTPEWLTAQTWFTIDYFLQGPDIGHNAVYHYDMLTDLKKIKAPGMIMTDRGDAIHPVDQRAAKTRPDFTYKEFSDDSTLSIMQHPVEWAKVVADYVKKTVH